MVCPAPPTSTNEVILPPKCPFPEQPLTGGNVSSGLVRVGDTVRRPPGPWSASVDALLIHLERSGFDGAPRALGYDERGRQVLSYVEGPVDPSPADLDRDRLREVGVLLRRFHDAAATFVPPPGAVWNVAIPPDAEELICHHDPAPWNLVRGARRLVLIDWDGAGPGSRMWDLAYAVNGFVPLSPEAGLDDEVLTTRVTCLVDGYGPDDGERSRLLSLLAPRVWSMYELLERGHRTGKQPWASLWDTGHGQTWRASARFVERRHDLLSHAILR